VPPHPAYFANTFLNEVMVELLYLRFSGGNKTVQSSEMSASYLNKF
jgi:hypothetical protein